MSAAVLDALNHGEVRTGRAPALLRLAFNLLLFVAATAAMAAQKEWTLLFYLGGDNTSLEGNAIDDFNALERGLDTNVCTAVVQLDRIPAYDTSNGDWSTCRRYLLQPDTNSDRTIRSALVEDLGEVNMGAGSTLADFLVWGLQTYPARCYAIIIWGSATPMGICPDASSSNDPLNVMSGELTAALAQANAATGKRIDLLVPWGCNFGAFEHDYSVKEFADVTARSQLATWNAGASATDLLRWLSLHPAATAREFATAWVDCYTDYAVSKGRCTGWAAVDLGPPFVRLGLALDTFARELIKAGGRDRPEISTAISNSVYCYALEFDLGHFAKNIMGNLALSSSVRQAAQAVLDAYGNPGFPLGKPLLHFRFAEGIRAANETWPTGNTAELRGTKIYKRDYSAFEPGTPPFGAGPCAYPAFKSNNAWKWFLAARTNLPNEPLLSFEATTLADTIPASGAPISVGVTLRNSGGGLARNISARLACADPQVSLLQASVAFPDMGSESNGVSLSPFLVSLRADTPARHRLWFWLEVMANDGTYTNTTSLCLETRDATLAGTPLAWLRAYGITNDVDQADLLDPDQDHLPTWQEYVAGTDPLKALSVFQILELKCLGASNRLSFHGTTNSGLASPFSVERATNLAAATPWQQLTTNLLRSASGTNTWWDTAPADGVPAFYRVRAR